MTEPRLLSGADAAAYCGITPATFSKWVAAGNMPKPVIGRRWDRKAIDLALDKLSGIEASPPDQEDEYTAWERGYEAREGPVTQNRGPREPWEDKFDAAWAVWLVQHETWNAEQPPSKRSSAADVERARQALRRVWKTL
jgi:predicted DNA-binding transcriptional regulator AlpA